MASHMKKDENKSYLILHTGLVNSINYKNKNLNLLVENVSEYLPNFVRKICLKALKGLTIK